MSYKISSDNFNHPLLKPILKELTRFFSDKGIRFFVIGATARDIVMEIHNESSGRLTHDLDIAITINEWSRYDFVEKEIEKLPNFSKDPNQKQRFFYLDSFQVDIVPFGEIMKEDSKIFWPPDEEFAMSVLGFSAVDETSLKVGIDNEIDIQVASLSGVFLLKIVAWKDRYHKTNKDADDIGFILNNYLEIYRDRSLEYFEEIYTEDHTILKGGATLLGIDLNQILKNHTETKTCINQILIDQIDKKEESILVNQILETHKLMNYDEVLKSLKNITVQLTT
ncbi:nucleotidyl transferase AbiEii/AbiGii toxin family protein [Sinomicrobium weinanense]|uniref:Nucleotidyl transferase AbiEii/AbiGii toxin family protein n=1 Tax=Sinomicrobium weinanense TaxID=2842200 RepID=A0A926JQF0_9FLAO|nr:nucleotidyl transferase AbiEii/AbiGii toxin family protein [Sinomicrobium weinanense]MBC9795419.1 nucleotidyl transferase AbiEii/AbiGii toxin family protein [Sinomicrobium weinanense]MBU3123944.1 nucleotidyl transferase AbiEii/AbiGii toxin family protein [Sinomicrobium weinanense]